MQEVNARSGVVHVFLALCLVLGVPLAMADPNALVLDAIASMPVGGKYATNLVAHRGLAAAVVPGAEVEIDARRAVPGYCSGATYLIFLKTLAALQAAGSVKIPESTWQALVPRLRPDGSDTLPDGQGVWGRWNANGPGTARLFFELGLGPNFTELAQAKPGDFLKIFWIDAVGKKERGHSVIYLGTETVKGEECLRYWSSNQPHGFGEASVPLTKVAHMLFSRLEHPARINDWKSLPALDTYLAGLLSTESSFAEACRFSGVR